MNLKELKVDSTLWATPGRIINLLNLLNNQLIQKN